MERLTQKDEYGNADIIAISDIMPEIYAGLSFSETNALTKALNRLAAYEDTGLTPEEIVPLREIAEILSFVHGDLKSKPRMWTQAEKNGRLVVLSDGDDTASLAATIDSTDMVRVWCSGDVDLLIGLLSMLAREVAQRAGIQYSDLLEAMSICPPVGTSSIIKTEEGKSNEAVGEPLLGQHPAEAESL